MITTRLNPLYEVKLIEDGRQHFYQIGQDEKWFPGVTTVLKVLDKPALIPWAVKMCSENIKDYLMANLGKTLTAEEIEKACLEGKNIYKKKSQEAADLGGRVHRAIDNIIHGGKPDLTEDIRPGVEGFLKWQESHKLNIEFGDTKLGSKLFGYGGSMDFLAFDGDEAVLWDLKTTKKRKDRDHGVYDEFGLQLGAYAQAFQETYGVRVKEAFILWVDKEKGDFKPVKVGNLSICLEAFLAALKIYQTNKIEKFEREV